MWPSSRTASLSARSRNKSESTEAQQRQWALLFLFRDSCAIRFGQHRFRYFTARVLLELDAVSVQTFQIEIQATGCDQCVWLLAGKRQLERFSNYSDVHRLIAQCVVAGQ